jgi:hypothetical protein
MSNPFGGKTANAAMGCASVPALLLVLAFNWLWSGCVALCQTASPVMPEIPTIHASKLAPERLDKMLDALRFCYLDAGGEFVKITKAKVKIYHKGDVKIPVWSDTEWDEASMSASGIMLLGGRREDVEEHRIAKIADNGYQILKCGAMLVPNKHTDGWRVGAYISAFAKIISKEPLKLNVLAMFGGSALSKEAVLSALKSGQTLSGHCEINTADCPGCGGKGCSQCENVGKITSQYVFNAVW